MKATILLIALSAALLSACSGSDVRSTLGLNRSAPDEFKVVSRPPLSVPPEFNLLPPDPGAPPLLDGDREKEARSLILDRLDTKNYDEEGGAGEVDVESHFKTLSDFAPKSVDTAIDPVMSSSLETSGEATFLSNAGAEKADPKIRETIYKDRLTQPEEDDGASPLERWLGLSESSSVVDPKAESERIKDNVEKGKPVNEGEVKTIDDKQDSVLDKLFE